MESPSTSVLASEFHRSEMGIKNLCRTIQPSGWEAPIDSLQHFAARHERIGNPEFFSQRLSKPLDRLINLLRTCRRKRSPEEHLLVRLTLGSEPTTLRAQYALVNRSQENRLFYRKQCLNRSIQEVELGMFLPGNPYPVEHPRFRRHPSTDLKG